MRRAKRKAAEEGRSLTALIEDALRRVVNEASEPEGKRVSPRVSTATGGLMPGVDWNDLDALQEMDDLETLRRLK